MELNEFKDTIFDLLNEDDTVIADIDTKEQGNIFIVKMVGGSIFEIKFQEHVK